MAFSQLSAHEKDAFFGLLDEFSNPLISRVWSTVLSLDPVSRYFASRPELLSNIAKSQGVRSAANAAHDAFKDPATRNSAIDTVKSGMNSARASWNTKRDASPEPAEGKSHNGPGRVAAAAASLMSTPRFGGPPTSTGPSKPPPPPARKASTNPATDDGNSPPLPSNKPPSVQRRESTAGSLTSTKTLGSDVDVTSARGFFTSIRNSSKNSGQPLTTPSSYLPPPSSGPKKQFAPPPVRRVTSESSSASATSTLTPPAPPPPARKKEEPAGEWAEVLYDFSGDQPEDLDVKESERILIVERSSDDWWMAEFGGKRGTVPASYVKLL